MDDNLIYWIVLLISSIILIVKICDLYYTQKRIESRIKERTAPAVFTEANSLHNTSTREITERSGRETWTTDSRNNSDSTEVNRDIEIPNLSESSMPSVQNIESN